MSRRPPGEKFYKPVLQGWHPNEDRLPKLDGPPDCGRKTATLKPMHRISSGDSQTASTGGIRPRDMVAGRSFVSYGDREKVASLKPNFEKKLYRLPPVVNSLKSPAITSFSPASKQVLISVSRSRRRARRRHV